MASSFLTFFAMSASTSFLNFFSWSATDRFSDDHRRGAGLGRAHGPEFKFIAGKGKWGSPVAVGIIEKDLGYFRQVLKADSFSVPGFSFTFFSFFSIMSRRLRELFTDKYRDDGMAVPHFRQGGGHFPAMQ